MASQSRSDTGMSDASGTSTLHSKAEPPSRSSTMSFLKRHKTEPVPPKPAKNTYSYAVYRLDWEKLRALLEGWFPGTEFQRKVVGDKYIFEVPGTMTSVHFAEIQQLTESEEEGKTQGKQQQKDTGWD